MSRCDAPAGAPANVMTVAITGASGFIGARLVAMLAEAGTCRPRILSRRRGAGDCLVVDLADATGVQAALQGCTAVVHCAFDFQDVAANLPIARAIARACIATGTRLVHVSTAAVHEPLPDGVLDETCVIAPGGTAYKQVKLAIEDALAGLAGEGLDLVILRPTIVYGPGGRAWTDSPIRELLTGTVVLPDEGRGLCNAVHVDDVCRAVIAALTAPIPSAERILVSGPQPVTWSAFYGAYRDILGVGCIALEASQAAAPYPAEGGGAPRHARAKRVVARLLGSGRLARLNLLLSFARSMILGAKRHEAGGAKLALFQARCEVRIDKAQRLLGYQPKLNLPKGMRMTAPYISQTYGVFARLRSKRPEPSGFSTRQNG